MEPGQADEIIALIEKRSFKKLISYALETDYLLENEGLAFRLWDAFLPPYDRPAGVLKTISAESLSLLENDQARSFLDPADIDEAQAPKYRKKLLKLLCRHFESPYYVDNNKEQQELHYYQGFHDVASVLVVKFGLKRALMLLDRLSRSKLRDFMHADMDMVVHFSRFTLRLLEQVDREVAAHLRKVEMVPHFLVGWLTTWFSHDLNSFKMSSRVFDVLVMLPPAAVGYASAALIHASRTAVLAMEGMPGTADWGHLHQTLKELPSSEQWSPQLLVEAVELMERYPPSTIIRGVPELRLSSFNQDLSGQTLIAPYLTTVAFTLVVLALAVALKPSDLTKFSHK